MTPELSIVKLFLNYAVWEQWRDKLSVKDFPKELQPVYSILDNWHSTNEAKANLTVADFANLVGAQSFKDKDYYLGVVEQLEKLDVSADTTAKLIRHIIQNKALNELSIKAHDAKEGRIDIEQVLSLFKEFEVKEEVSKDIYISDDIESLVSDVIQTPGLRWRLTAMNKMLGSLRFGDFGFVFARPETGKTTFLASELTYMAEQATKPVLWLANEEDGKKVMIRLYQATFGIDLPTLLSSLPKWKNLFYEKYEGRLKLVADPSIMTKGDIQRLCDKLDPALVVIDQLSKISGFKDDRKDLELGAACEWARSIAKIYCPVVAVHQADGTGDGVKWLNMNHVSNAKTAMQAEADFMLGIGKVHDAGYDSLRYLHLSKNKLIGDIDTDPNLRHGKMEVLIDAPIARYKDIL